MDARLGVVVLMNYKVVSMLVLITFIQRCERVDSDPWDIWHCRLGRNC